MKVPGLLVSALSSLLLWGPAAAQADPTELRFCVCSNAMPRAGEADDGQFMGVDVAVAKLLAEKLDRRSAFHACANDACRLQSLKSGQCDVVIGLPHQSVDSPEIDWTHPYASGKFALLAPDSEQRLRSLTELHGKRVGIVSGTVPLSAKEYEIVGFPSQAALMRGFKQADLDGALVDVDYSSWFLQQHPQLALRLVEEFVSTHRWSIGIAVRAEHSELRDELSRAIQTCLRQAEFRELFANHGLVYRPPLVEDDAKTVEIVNDTWKRIEEGGNLVVSMDPANLPYSSADTQQPGLDVEIARAVAKELGVKLQLEWIDVHRETAVGQLLEHESDLAFGSAIDPQAIDDEEELAGKVIYSRPYYGTGYFLIARQDAEQVNSLTELQGEKSRRLGTQAGTIADYSLRQRGYLRRLFGTQLATLSALDSGGIDYAYLWSNAGWLLHKSPDIDASLVNDYVPEDRWNIAIAMRTGDVRLKAKLDHALDQVIQQGDVQAALRRYHVPYLSPFDVKPDTKEEVSRRGPVDRGLEPRMSRRQRSRQSYDGLAKVRSRGTLIVGLDQKNLPFSTTHPEPAGLDYEVAQLLAKQLGVSLEVYWAYSSHDSYPAKLAHKRLCDVILGVMPDDRFGDRVTYSDPYYFAKYMYVMPAEGENADFDLQPIAVEPGIAVRDLAGRTVQPYPDLETIIAAVADGEVPMGYVISSRARWLAETQWAGRVRFVPTESTQDRFSICAAVRRDENDLRVALNEALRELHNTGQLQQAFARWHVPMNR